MSAVVHDLRAFHSAIDQARKANLGPNATHAVIRAVTREQRAGRDGNAVAGQLQRARLRGEHPTPPEAA